MPYTIEKLPKSTIEIKFTIPTEEVEPFLRAAADELSRQTKIPGFRPGHVPYEMAKQRLGEQAIWEQALESIVRKYYVKAVMEQDLDTIGSPEINVSKLAPGNPIEFTVKVASVPQITKLADYKTQILERRAIEISQDKVDKVVADLAKMQTREEIVQRPAEKADKIVIDMDLLQNRVPIEGGKSADFHVYLSEKNYLPGLCENLIGLKKGDEKTFALEFPKEHHLKRLAGQKVDCQIKVKDVYKLETPVIDDAFAKSLGQENLAKLKELLQGNLKQEEQQNQETKLENQMFEHLIANTNFSDIPDLLVNEEVNKMIAELKHNVEHHQGVNFDDYLKQIKKDLGQLKLNMTPEALRRIKAALIMREIALRENIQATEEELDKEQDSQASQFKPNDEQRKQIYSPEYRDYLKTILRNRKTIFLLKKNMIK